MKRRNLLTFFVGILTCCLCVVAINNGTAHAAVDNQRIMRKWLLTQYFNCAKDNINTPLTAKANGLVSDDVFSAVGDMKLPSYNFMHSVQNGAVDCKTVFVGSNEFKGLLDVYDSADKSVDWASPSESQSFLEKVGYSAEGTSGGEQEFAIKATYTGRMYQYQFYCGWFGISCESPLEGQEETVKIKAIRDGGKLKYSFANSKSGFWDALKVEIDDQYLTIKTDPSFWSACSDPSGQEKKFRLRDDLPELFKEINDAFANNTWDLTCTQLDFSGGGNDWYYDYHYHFIAGDIVDSGAGGDYTYPNGSERYDATKDGIKRLTGASMNDIELTNSEMYTLYYYYLDQALPDNVLNRMTCSPDSTLNLTAVKLKSPDGTFKECYVNFNGTDPSSISVFTQKSTDHRSRQPYSYIDSITIQDVIDWFNSVDTNTLGDVDIVVGESVNGSQPGEGGQQSCYSGSGALGWILCPVIEAVASAGNTMWNNIEQNHLQVPAGDIFQRTDGVSRAWGVIRDIANVLFIVLLLMVIFSQLTGVGIDNYGIKKILPRLIMVAILVNLSYIICELAIDLSNILGNGLNSMLSGFADNVAGGIDAGASVGEQIGGWTFDLLLAGGGAVLFAFLNPAGFVAGLAAIGIAVLGFVITIVVAVLTLYIIVIVRSAGIILCVVLAPAAIVCYALPNTEKLAKRWFGIFKALLVVYPICGAMVGAGQLAGAVLVTIPDNPSMHIAAMVVQVLPFFLIPTLLKNSLALMGNVGAKIGSMGRSLGAKGSAKAQGAVKNSEKFKNWSQYQQEKTAANRAGRVQTRLRNRMASGKTLSTREQDKLRRADDTVLAWQSREKVNARRTSEQSYAAREAAIETENEKAKVADYESLLENGRAFEADGVTAVNINDPNSVGRYHAEALARYEAATSDAERGEAMSQIKAAQNILSKTDKGRAQVQNNLETALKNGQVAGLSGASAHLMGNFGDTYKSKNRGAHKMIQDLATTNLSDARSLGGLQTKIADGSYAFAGTDKYTAESLAGADDAALDRFVDGVNNGSLTGNELANIQATAYEALQKSKSGTLNIKPEVSRKLEQIIGSNYVPAAMPNNRATVLSHGAYEDSAGNVAHLREMSNGKYLDDGDFEVDITHYKKR